MPRIRSLAATAVAVLPAMSLSPVTAPSPAIALSPAAHRAEPRQVKPAGQVWHLAVERHYGQPGNASGYSTIVTAGRRIWAFGGTNPGGLSSPVATVRIDGTWRAVSLPTGLSDFLSDASATSATDLWAISGYGRYVLHWDGSQWTISRRWGRPGTLSGLCAVSRRDVWVFGTSILGARTLGTWHFDGKSWAEIKGQGGSIYRASAVTAHDIWAILAGQRSDSIVRFNGRRWRQIRTGPALKDVRWHDILAESETDVWLVGDTASRLGSGQLVFAHWNGRLWMRSTTSLRVWPGQLTSAGTDRVAATAASSGILGAGLIVQLTSRGRLSVSTIASSFGTGVSDIAYAPWSHTLWTSGGILTRLGGNAAAWELLLLRPDVRGDIKLAVRAATKTS